MRLRILPTILICTLGAISIFGLFGGGFMEHGQYACPFTLLSGGDCPPMGDVFAFASHHVSVFHQFTQAPIGFDTALYAISLLLFSFLLAFLWYARKDAAIRRFIYYKQHAVEYPRIHRQRQLLRWIALRNKRGPFLFSAAHGMV